ncbi:BamA/TamA family outer membrane protein [Carboxylicivirga sp. M1479]|uniref:translocation and assembly module lipoprotein TamL n=1 Tax=Carboxylicivirga sp. M1479 TaxID=2594476 RepID=UPI00117884FA|nr:BamA/TamA family outer membrane protein [Carboxylicivirga sp. M1479]TRX64325.1 BamA/TamA family outer membrane protein [Carboxylicivirga sp. M1479]
MGNKFILLVGVVLIIGMFGCRSTKYVPDNAYLLNKIEIESEAKDISKEELKYYVRQKENGKILGFWRFHLGLYNLSGRDAAKGFNQWLRRIGEEPVLYDGLLKQKSNEQMRLFLNNKGYYNAVVTDTVLYKKNKKAKVRYSIQAGERYHIGNLSYRVDDDSIRNYVLKDTTNALLKSGAPFDAELHDKERSRITRAMRNKGYYAFRKEFVYFLADSALGNYTVNDSLIVMKDRIVLQGKNDSIINHRKFKIKDVYFLVGYEPQKALDGGSDYLNSFESVEYEGCKLLYGTNLDFRADVLINSNYIFPGDYYNQDLVDKTQRLLSELQLFRFVNIRFKEVVDAVNDQEEGQLECFIQLSSSKLQSYTVDVEGTNSSGNLGAAGSFKYKHKNFMRGGEVFNMGFRLAGESQRSRSNENFQTLEAGADATLTIPKFMVPFKIENFRKRYNPRTNFTLAYNYQRRPDYTRTIASGRIGYSWKSSALVSHYLAPIDFSVVNVPYIDPEFQKQIEPTFLKYSYEDHLISSTSYSYTYNEQSVAGNKNYHFFQANIQSAGNLIDGLSSLVQENRSKEYNEVFGIRYAQYIKADIDWRYHIKVNPINAFAYRIFMGAGYPYGNLTVMPFERRYFSGGANSIRAWPVRGLGPGSYEETQLEYYNQTADIKLEANAEYRFKLFWLLEGAFFVDIGNIWTIRSSGDEDIDLKGLFEFNKFYKQIAVGVGTGARLDFSYFVFRLDMGIKARDPILPEGNRWVLGVQPIKWNDMAFNFAIGYPF